MTAILPLHLGMYARSGFSTGTSTFSAVLFEDFTGSMKHLSDIHQAVNAISAMALLLLVIGLFGRRAWRTVSEWLVLHLAISSLLDCVGMARVDASRV